MESNHKEIAESLVSCLQEWGAYIYHEAVTTDSIYVKFPHWGLGSIRIADHRGKARYAYRWNVMTGNGTTFHEKKQGQVIRRFYGVDYLNLLVKHFVEAAESRGIKPGDKQEWKDRFQREPTNQQTNQQGETNGQLTNNA